MTTSSTDDVEGVIARLRAAGRHVSPDRRVPLETAAELIGIAPKTLRNWRSGGNMPPGFPQPLVIGRRHWYFVAQLLDWIKAQRAESKE